MTRLANGRSVVVDLGATKGLTVTNIHPNKSVTVFVDYDRGGGNWSAITGAVSLKPGEALVRTRQALGHETVRVGVDGPDDGRDLVAVQP